MRFVVLEAGQRIRSITAEGLRLLHAHGQVDLVTLALGFQAQGMSEFLGLLPEADAAVISPWLQPSTTPEDWSHAGNLKVLAGTFDNRFAGWMDLADLQQRGIAVIDTSRSMTPSVAEFALAMTLNLIRDIPASIDIVRRGEWKPQAWENPGFTFGDLTGRRVGLAGLGSINRRYAELLTPFRCVAHAYDPFVSREVFDRYGLEPMSSLVELARSSEILVIGIPPTPATLGIISQQVIDALPKGALIVLVTRMAVVEQEALWRRVEAGEIMAAVDVFAPEPPPPDVWFRRHPHVLPTPHVAGDTMYCHRRCFTDACQDAITVLTGGQPRFQATSWDDDLYQGRL
jgi:phosphoglycerate dehydrogenase-like enzyme